MMDLSQLYMLEMMRKRRLRNTIREDIAWDILVETGGATHTIKVQCLTGQTTIIDWGDNTSTEATATTLTSYAHNYPAGTFEISITGGVYRVQSYSTDTDNGRNRIIRNINCPGMIAINSAFGSASANPSCTISEGCRIAASITNVGYAFRNITTTGLTIPASMVLPAGITAALGIFQNDAGISKIPLSFWPAGGFTSAGSIDLQALCIYATGILGSIAPSQILWDSGKTFSVTRFTFYPNNATAWLNYAAAYTDPVSGITYSKIPYAWGGAAD